MTMQMLARFLIGGAVVSVFAALADVLRPKSFAGIFGAAPSIALATLALTIHSRGAGYASVEARSMSIGAVALLAYAWVSCRALWSGRASAVTVTLCALPVWLLGGLVTAAAAAIANTAGPVFGGLFLAFPALFTASATLIERREISKKARHGLHGRKRGRRAAALDAAGTVLGSLGLACFAVIVWQGLPHNAPVAVLGVALAGWLTISVSLWWIHKQR